MSRLSRPFWILLALVFLAEAWLWENVAPLFARILAALPIERLRAALRARIEGLSPPATLPIFLAPVVLLLPLKVAGLWLLAHGLYGTALLVIVSAKALGLGLAGFIFDITRPKLLQMAWFRAAHDLVLGLYRRAHALIDPYVADLRATLRAVRAVAVGRLSAGGSKGPLARMRRMRRRALAARI